MVVLIKHIRLNLYYFFVIPAKAGMTVIYADMLSE